MRYWVAPAVLACAAVHDGAGLMNCVPARFTVVLLCVIWIM
jgi:hypothetical protein